MSTVLDNGPHGPMVPVVRPADQEVKLVKENVFFQILTTKAQIVLGLARIQNHATMARDVE